MVSRHVATVDEYLATLAAPERDDLARLREMIRMAAPAAVETVRHGMPCYELAGGRMICAFAAQKRHLALYLADASALRVFADRLPASARGKGCLRFRSLRELPPGLIDEAMRGIGRRASDDPP